MGIRAAIDLGTNSLKMHVADLSGGHWRPLLDELEVTRLGEGLSASGGFSGEAMERNVRTLRSFARRARELGAGEIAAVGTMALRRAANAGEFIDRVQREAGLDLEVISGEEEARLSAVAAMPALGEDPGRWCIFDTGGGSTEFIIGEGSGTRRSFSLDVGCRVYTERFLSSDPVQLAEYENLREALAKDLGEIEAPVDRLLGIGGTATTLGAVMLEMKVFRPQDIQGLELPMAEILRQQELYRSCTLARRRQIAGLLPSRADVILAGLAIIRTIMEKTGRDRLLLSERALRHGLLQDRFLRS